MHTLLHSTINMFGTFGGVINIYYYLKTDSMPISGTSVGYTITIFVARIAIWYIKGMVRMQT